MDDLISRQEAIDALGEEPEVWTEDEYQLGLYNQWNYDINVLKAVPPAQQWTPASVDTPKDSKLKFVTYNDPRSSEPEVWIGWHEADGVWFIEGEEHSKENGNEVTAWMPLPEPYKEG